MYNGCDMGSKVNGGWLLCRAFTRLARFPEKDFVESTGYGNA